MVQNKSRPVAVLGFAVLGCVAWLLSSCRMPELTRVSSSQGQFPVPQDCAHCHVEIYNEWAHSPHAVAFVSESYRRATDDYHFRECLGCHAPEPMLTSGQPATRSTELDLGVVCVTCHLDHGAMVGPNEPTGFAKPHPITVNKAFFENGTLCGRCHQSTLAQWQSAQVEPKQDCRSCHMPEVRRTMTQATGMISKPIVAAEHPGVEHQHLFTLAARDVATKSCDLRTEVVSGELAVTLVNLLPHNLPTGDFGVRTVQVTATAVDAAGKQSELGKWEVNGSVGGAIPSGGSRSWRVALPSTARRLDLQVLHRGRDQTDELVMLHQEVHLP